MQVVSTRGTKQGIPATLAVLQGISEDGGLFVPEYFPEINMEEMAAYAAHEYDILAAKVLGLFFDVPGDKLAAVTQQAYLSFDDAEIVPIRKLAGGKYVMELTHGPTLAFKDMALQVLPRLIRVGLEIHNQQENVLILTATSGDTGKAAMEGFKDVPRTAILVFYPADGVATMQKLQMVTQEGGNVSVCGVDGNFDDAQTGVKELFANEGLRGTLREAGYTFSSANSINIGRLVPQVAYYVYAAARLMAEGTLKPGGKVNFVVPTGNFGNILAAYYAKRMGVPVGKLVCASNRNNILTDFFRQGTYDVKRTFYKTMSPSMDILISSNLERLLYEITGRDASAVRSLMEALKTGGAYTVSADAKRQLDELFYADYCDEAETQETIKRTFEQYGYLIDTHTAVAQCVCEKYRQATGDETPTVVVSTANPYKFPQDVLHAVSGETMPDAFEAAARLSALTHTQVPAQIKELRSKPVLHDGSAKVGELVGVVEEFLNSLGN